MKRLELTTSLVSMSRFFCTYWGNANPEVLLNEDIIQEDFDGGYTDVTPDYYFDHFDNKKYVEEISKRTHPFMEDFLVELLGEFNIDINYYAEGYNQPREYNFRGDRHDFDIEAKSFQPLIDFCVAHEYFPGFLKENYSSRDGFMSFTSNNIHSLLEDIEEDDMTAWGAVLSFIIRMNREEEDIDMDVTEELRQDIHYGDFIDHTELEEFLEDLKSGETDYLYLDKDWEKEVFKKYVGDHSKVKQIVNDNYLDKPVDFIIDQVMTELGLLEDPASGQEDIVRKAVISIMMDIESHVLELEL